MTLALVFAMSGGALAAKHYLITSTKQISPKVLKKLKGNRGPAGKDGVNGVNGKDGVNGVNGKDGVNGVNGKDGAPGESVSSKAVATSEKAKCGGQGGVEYTVTGKTTTVCNGSPWSAGGVLPSGKTLTGEWNVAGYATEANQRFRTSVSYVLSLATAPTTHFVRPNESAPTGCTGSVSEPGAEPGNLCVFALEESNSLQEFSIGQTHFHFPTLCNWATGSCSQGSPTAEGEGGLLGFGVQGVAENEGLMEVMGTWAVTAAEG